MKTKNNITILGAGIAGVASAYHLSTLQPDLEIIVIDKLDPLSFTSSCSGENFREYWPQPMMNAFVGRSIELMQNLGTTENHCFNMKYSGYDFVTHLDNHSIFPISSNNQDIVRIDDSSEIRHTKPYLDKGIKAVEYIRNAGSIDAYALGSLLIKLAKANGVRFIKDEVVNISKTNHFQLILNQQENIKSTYLLLSSGPFINNHAELLGYKLPIYNLKQQKFVFTDTQGIIPRNMPFTIYADEQFLEWEDEERQIIQDDDEFKWLLKEFPAGLHIKPEGQNKLKMGWAFNTKEEDPLWNIIADKEFVNIVLKGASRFIPDITYYENNTPPDLVQFAGYYTRTDDNLPVIGKLENNIYIAGALAGYGTMAACAVGELISKIIVEEKTPTYSHYFSPLRFNNTKIMDEISNFPSGQL